MKSKLVSDHNRKVHFNMDIINIYTSKWKPGTPFDFELTRRVARKSDPIRKYYWGVVMVEFCKGFFYEPDEDKLVHKHLKIKYFRIEPDEHGIYRDKDIPSVFSDESELNIEQKWEFIEYVRRQAAMNDVYIQDPNE